MSSSKRKSEEDDEPVSGSSNSKSAKTLDPILAKEMTEWQQEKYKVRHRDSYIMEKEMFTDCSFTMGEGENMKEVKCHRAYLAKTSSVFASMLFGDLKEVSSPIHLPDVNLESFLAMRKFIYIGGVKLKDYNYEVLCGLLKISKKFQLHKLFLCHIRGYLWRYMYPNNVWMALNFASSNNEPHLEETAWKLIDKRFPVVVSDPSFLEISFETLLSVVQREEITCPEVEIFMACKAWARNMAEKKGLGEEAIREILTPIIPHIRFLTMTGKEFVDSIADTNILDKDQKNAIAFNIISPDSMELPANICTTQIPRREGELDSFYVEYYPEQICKFRKLNVGDYFEEESTITVFTCFDHEFEVGESFKGLQYFSQWSGGDLSVTKDKTYLENLYILVCTNVDGRRQIISKNVIKRSSCYNSRQSLHFTKSIDITPDCKQLSIVTLIYKSGYYLSHIPRVIKKRVTGEYRVLDDKLIKIISPPNFKCVLYFF